MRLMVSSRQPLAAGEQTRGSLSRGSSGAAMGSSGSGNTLQGGVFSIST